MDGHVKEVHSCLAVPVPGQSDWLKMGMELNTVVLKGSQDFKVNTLLKVKGEFESDEVVKDGDDPVMAELLSDEWSGMPVCYFKEYTVLTQSDLLPKELKKSIKEARLEMLTMLTNVLSGDEIAAEYLMLHLLSKMYVFSQDNERSELSQWQTQGFFSFFFFFFFF